MSDMHKHEKQDLRFVTLLKVWLGLALCLVVVGAVSKILFEHLQKKAAPVDSGPESTRISNQVPRAPRLQMNPVVDLRDLQKQEDDKLLNYAWIDRTHGRVRVPISRAMALLAERGLPVRK